MPTVFLRSQGGNANNKNSINPTMRREALFIHITATKIRRASDLSSFCKQVIPGINKARETAVYVDVLKSTDTFYTFSVWKDEETLDHFLASKENLEAKRAAKNMASWCRRHTLKTSEVPSWADVMETIKDEGTTFEYPEPRRIRNLFGMLKSDSISS